jgi:FkbM family methyltransferase
MSAETLGVVVETRQGIFCIDTEDQFVSKALLERGEYGQGEISNLSNFLRPSSRMLLVGAHIGSLLVPLSKRVESIVGIEANPRTFKRLRLNTLLNECHNVRLFNVAASDSAETIEFVMNTANSGASKRMPIVRNAVYFADKPEIAQVAAMRLDDLLPDERFDVVFMDIEGSEVFAMRGMPRILAGARAVVAEFYPFMVREVAGATVEEFLQPLSAFSTLVIPSLGKSVGRADFQAALQDMFDKDQCDNGLVFVRDEIRVQFA